MSENRREIGAPAHRRGWMTVASLAVAATLLLSIGGGAAPAGAPPTSHPSAVAVSGPAGSPPDSGGPQLFGAVVRSGANTLTLAPNATTYIYAAGFAGRGNRSGFLSGEYASATNASGSLTAALAQSSLSLDAVSAPPAAVTIAGVGVAGYSSSNETFAARPLDGSSSISIEIRLSSEAFLVLVAVAGSACCVSIGGLEGISVAAQSAANASSGIAIAQANVDSGVHTILASVPAGANRSAAGALLLGIFAFSTEDSLSLDASVAPNPPFTVSGAAATGTGGVALQSASVLSGVTLAIGAASAPITGSYGFTAELNRSPNVLFGPVAPNGTGVVWINTSASGAVAASIATLTAYSSAPVTVTSIAAPSTTGDAPGSLQITVRASVPGELLTIFAAGYATNGSELASSPSFEVNGLPATPATDGGCLSGEDGGGSSCAVAAYFEASGAGNYTITGNLSEGGGTWALYAAALAVVPPTPVHAIAFTETGLPLGSAWSVALGGSVRGSENDTIQFAEPNGSYVWTVSTTLPGWAAAVSNGTISVAGASVTVSVLFRPTLSPTFSVTIAESGLPAGVNWSVELGDRTFLSSPSLLNGTEIAINLPNGSYSFVASAGNGSWVALPPSGTVIIAGANVTTAVEFVSGTPIRFDETGLPLGTEWLVRLRGVVAGPTTPGLGVQVNYTLSVEGVSATTLVPSGSYSYSVPSPIAGWSVVGGSGNFSANGTSLSISVAFEPIAAFALTFTERGLPAGTPWAVQLAARALRGNASTIVAIVANGTYLWSIGPTAGFQPSPSNGSIRINGSSATIAIQFSSPASGEVPITFAEVGLAGGVAWSVELEGSQNGSEASGLAGASISFLVTNGTYQYEVEVSNRSWQSLPQSGVVVVGTTNVTVLVTFVPAFVASVSESGLPSGVSWYVNLTGIVTLPAGAPGSVASIGLHARYSFVSQGTQVVLSLPNGTYAYRISASGSGWTPSQPTGNLTVQGQVSAPQFGTSFGPVASPSSGPLGLSLSDLLVLVAVGSLVFALGVAVGVRRRRGPPPSASSHPSPSASSPTSSEVEDELSDVL